MKKYSLTYQQHLKRGTITEINKDWFDRADKYMTILGIVVMLGLGLVAVNAIIRTIEYGIMYTN